jgi:hypothetical protein
MPLVACGAAALIEVCVLGRVAPAYGRTARVWAAIAVVALTAVGIVVFMLIVLASANCPPNSYECPL